MTHSCDTITLSRQQGVFYLPMNQSCLRKAPAPRQNRQTVDRTGLLGINMKKGSGRIPDCHPGRKHCSKGLCKSCYDVLWRKENGERIREQRRKYWHENNEACNSYHRQWKANHRDKVRERARIYREGNSESLLEKHRKYNMENKDAINEKSRQYASLNPEKIIDQGLKQRYYITLKDYSDLFQKQNGVCAICGTPGGKKRLCVDHDHQTGKVRGLLCDNCNVGIGRLKDNSELCHRASLYLAEHSS
jgi:hypothetical protein